MYHPAVQLTMCTVETENLFSFFNITVMRQNSETYIIGTKILRVFFLAIHSHLYKRIPPAPLEQKWFETGL
jgi:hypothetical protein